MLAAFTNHASFARREVTAPAGLWERGPEASGCIPPSGRLFPLSDLAPPPAVDPRSPHRAPKAFAVSPSGETGASPSRGVEWNTPALPSQLAGEAERSGSGAPSGSSGLEANSVGGAYLFDDGIDLLDDAVISFCDLDGDVLEDFRARTFSNELLFCNFICNREQFTRSAEHLQFVNAIFRLDRKNVEAKCYSRWLKTKRKSTRGNFLICDFAERFHCHKLFHNEGGRTVSFLRKPSSFCISLGYFCPEKNRNSDYSDYSGQQADEEGLESLKGEDESFVGKNENKYPNDEHQECEGCSSQKYEFGRLHASALVKPIRGREV
jgi:hypothetical protein